MPLVNLQQFKRVFVEVFASIKSLAVGQGGAPGPGNLRVENNLIVGGQIIAPNMTNKAYFVFTQNGPSGNDRTIYPANLSGDGIPGNHGYRMLKNGAVTGISANLWVDTPGTMQGNVDPYVNIRVNAGEVGLPGLEMEMHVNTSISGTAGHTYLHDIGFPDLPFITGNVLWVNMDSTPNQSLTPSITRGVVIYVEVTYTS